MTVNGITANTYIPSAVSTKKTSEKSSPASDSTSSADVYEKSTNETDSTTAKEQSAAVIKALKADADKRSEQLRSLVEKMMLSQGKTFDTAGMWDFLRSGEYTVDEETAKQAQADIAEDGYWGVEQTSDRLVSFAKALAVNDPEKAGDMLEAVKTGFEQAAKAWGGDLPDICQKTLDATIKKLNDWKASAASTSDTTADSVK